MLGHNDTKDAPILADAPERKRGATQMGTGFLAILPVAIFLGPETATAQLNHIWASEEVEV